MKSKKRLIRKKNERPWVEFYQDAPANLKYPNISIVDLLRKSAEKYPDNVAYEYFGNKCSYRELIGKIEHVARALKSYGVEKNDRVKIGRAHV